MMELGAQVRGAQVHMDRPRMVVGMLKVGHDVIRIGIVKGNFQPSQAMWAPVGESRDFTRDAATLTLRPIGDGPLPAVKADEGETEDRAFAALQKLLLSGKVVRRTGRSELYQQKLPDLAGLARAALQNAVASLVAKGRIENGADGLNLPTAKLPAEDAT